MQSVVDETRARGSSRRRLLRQQLLQLRRRHGRAEQPALHLAVSELPLRIGLGAFGHSESCPLSEPTETFAGRAGISLSDPTWTSNSYRLSRHAARYNGDLRTSSTVVLDKPMSASSRSSSSRSCLYWDRRSHSSAIPASHDNGLFQDHLEPRKDADPASRVFVELPQGMFHLRIGAKQRLAAEAHRAVVKGPRNSCITRLSGAQAIVSGRQPMKPSCGLPRFKPPPPASTATASTSSPARPG
jgi:hypothetical protein